jgi:hypothetical protein
MTSERIKQIQETTAYPESVSVKQALLQVWNECSQEARYSEEEVLDMFHKFSMDLPLHYEFLVKEQFKKK